MNDFLSALADDLAAADDGWAFDAAGRCWTHARTGLVVRHQFSRTVEVSYPGGRRERVRPRGDVRRDDALDVATQLVTIASALATREAS